MRFSCNTQLLISLFFTHRVQDPINQVPGYGDLLLGLSLIDKTQRDYMAGIEQSIVGMIQNQQWEQAFDTFDPLMMGDFWPVSGVADTMMSSTRLLLLTLPFSPMSFFSFSATVWQLFQQRNGQCLCFEPFLFLSGSTVDCILTD